MAALTDGSFALGMLPTQEFVPVCISTLPLTAYGCAVACLGIVADTLPARVVLHSPKYSSLHALHLYSIDVCVHYMVPAIL